LKEIEEQIAEEARCLDDFKARYQNLVDDLQRSEIVTKSAKGVIVSVRAVIAKAQALIHNNELKLANERKRVEELEAAKGQVQQELNVHTLKLGALQAQLATKKFISEEESRAQALAKIKEAHQRDIQCLRKQIQSLAKQE